MAGWLRLGAGRGGFVFLLSVATDEPCTSRKGAFYPMTAKSSSGADKWKSQPTWHDEPDRLITVQVSVPLIAADSIKEYGQKLREVLETARMFSNQIDRLVSLINILAEPLPIDRHQFIQCLVALRPCEEWRPHMAAFFACISPDATRDLVFTGVVSFEDLYRAARTWGETGHRYFEWIRKMADIRVRAERHGLL